jgi:hypothetical protein
VLPKTFLLLMLCYLKMPFYRSVHGNLINGSVPPTIWSNITFTENRTLVLYDNIRICSLIIRFDMYFYVIQYSNNAGTSKITPLTLFHLHLSLQKLSRFCKFLYHGDISSLVYTFFVCVCGKSKHEAVLISLIYKERSCNMLISIVCWGYKISIAKFWWIC